MVTISSCVINYKTPQDLHHFCLSYDGTKQDELFIVNVDPDYEDVEVAHEWCGTLGAHYVEFQENVGYAKAVNRAMSIAHGDVFAIFNADVKLRPGALHQCAEALLSEPSWGVLGPLQVDDSGRCTHPGIFGTHAKPEWRTGGWMNPVKPEWREVRDDAVTVMGSAYFVKKDVWRELSICPIYLSVDPQSEGAFLQTHLTYEETWCSYHAAAHGFKVVFLGTTEVVHNWHGSVKKNKKEGEFSRSFVDAQPLFREACKAHHLDCDV
jgi:GT2 family glycosyltransferase